LALQAKVSIPSKIDAGPIKSQAGNV